MNSKAQCFMPNFKLCKERLRMPRKEFIMKKVLEFNFIKILHCQTARKRNWIRRI